MPRIVKLVQHVLYNDERLYWCRLTWITLYSWYVSALGLSNALNREMIKIVALHFHWKPPVP